MRAAGPGWWLAAVAATTLTNLLDFATVPVPGTPPGGAFYAAMAVRIVGVFYVTYAVARAMAGVARPPRPTAALGRFVAFALVLSIAFGLFSLAGTRVLGISGRPLATQWLMLLAVQTLWVVALIRLVGLQNGYAAGARWSDTRTMIAATRGHAVPLAAVMLQLVIPFAAMHGALTLLGVRLVLTQNAVAALSLVDGVVSAIQLLLNLALGTVAWRMAGLRAEGARG